MTFQWNHHDYIIEISRSSHRLQVDLLTLIITEICIKSQFYTKKQLPTSRPDDENPTILVINILISQYAVALGTSTGHMCLNQACMRNRLSHIQGTCRLRTAANPDHSSPRDQSQQSVQLTNNMAGEKKGTFIYQRREGQDTTFTKSMCQTLFKK